MMGFHDGGRYSSPWSMSLWWVRDGRGGPGMDLPSLSNTGWGWRLFPIVEQALASRPLGLHIWSAECIFGQEGVLPSFQRRYKMQNPSNDKTKKVMDQQQLPPRRAYRRYTVEVWDKHRDIIRRLFLDQDKTYKEVLAVLEQDHSLTIGERQLKRKTEEWGFFKNIPSNEMDKMVRTQARRKQQLGRPTRFRRKQGDGEFYNVSSAKIALHERRMDMGSLSPTSSTSSGLPSNIECLTPTNSADSPREPVTVTTPTSHSAVISSPEPALPPASAVLLAAELAMDAKYQEAASHFRQLNKLTSSPWGSVLFDFNAHIMDAASNGGCPHTVATRISNILSRYLFREREKHRMSSLLYAGKRKETLEKVLSGLRMNARFWGSVVIQQRALQIWEPILGSDHPKIVLLHEGLALKRRGKVVNLDTNTRMVKSRNSEFVRMDLDARPWVLWTVVKEEDDLLYPSDYPLDELLGELELTGRANGERFTHEMAMLRFGRSRALAGLNYSFADRFADAQMAFHDSARTLEYETCIEIKLHRMLWHAEHKTRIRDWEGAWDLTCRSHKVFFDAERPSQSFARHFMGRFTVLTSAIRQRKSVDKTRGLGGVDRLREQGDSSRLPASGMESSGGLRPSPPSSAQETPSSEVSRFLPESLTSVGDSGIHVGIDIGAWLQVVHSSLRPT